MWLPAAPSQAQSSFQRAGCVVPHMVSHYILAHRLRTSSSQKWTCSHTKPGCSPITSNHKISQTSPFLLSGDWVRNLDEYLTHIPRQGRLIYIISKSWSQLYTWWSIGTGPNQKKTRLRRISQRKPCSSLWALSCVSASSPCSGSITWFWTMLFIFKQWKDIGTKHGWKKSMWTFREQWYWLEVRLNNSKDLPVITILTCSKQHGQKYLELTLPLAGESLIS